MLTTTTICTCIYINENIKQNVEIIMFCTSRKYVIKAVLTQYFCIILASVKNVKAAETLSHLVEIKYFWKLQKKKLLH